jgi:UPF0716 protein FxsA
MLFYLFLLFTLVPLVELAILIRIGYATEWWVPLLLVILTGIIGAALARWQGFHVLERIRGDLRAGRMPTESLIDGFLVLLAGILLVTPGVVTDVAGCVLLIPPIRALVKRAALAWAKRNIEVRMSTAGEAFRSGGPGGRPSGGDQIIDAKVINTRVEDVG